MEEGRGGGRKRNYFCLLRNQNEANIYNVCNNIQGPDMEARKNMVILVMFIY